MAGFCDAGGACSFDYLNLGCVVVASPPPSPPPPADCDCDFHAGGCPISEAAPEGKACKCVYKGGFTCGGDVVSCGNPASPKCAAPDKSVASCTMGGGDCGGYMPSPPLPRPPPPLPPPSPSPPLPPPVTSGTCNENSLFLGHLLDKAECDNLAASLSDAGQARRAARGIDRWLGAMPQNSAVATPSSSAAYAPRSCYLYTCATCDERVYITRLLRLYGCLHQLEAVLVPF